MSSQTHNTESSKAPKCGTVSLSQYTALAETSKIGGLQLTGACVMQLSDGSFSKAVGVPILSASLETTGMDATSDASGADLTSLVQAGQAALDALALSQTPPPVLPPPPGSAPNPTPNPPPPPAALKEDDTEDGGLGLVAIIGIVVGGVVGAGVLVAAAVLLLMRARKPVNSEVGPAPDVVMATAELHSVHAAPVGC